jgi:hypothetical protein
VGQGAPQEGERDQGDEAPQDAEDQGDAPDPVDDPASEDGGEGHREHRQDLDEGRDPPQDFIGRNGLHNRREGGVKEPDHAEHAPPQRHAGPVAPRQDEHDGERQSQRYISGEDIPDPSVITLNALGASQAMNDFLFIVTGLLRDTARSEHILIHPRDRTTEKISLRRDPACSMCSLSLGSVYALGDRGHLPCRQ